MSRLIDQALSYLLVHLGSFTYAILFLIVFVETGVVVFPFLPGDSLLFALGALAARPGSPLLVGALYPLLIAAALIGDNCNYALGRRFGRRLFAREDSRLFRQENLVKTEAFFAKHGPKAILLARFVPIVRTFAPFVAGMGAMPYPRFLLFSVVGAMLWVGSCVTAGIFFGNLGPVKKNFELVIVAIVLVSVLPMALEYYRARREGEDARR